MEELICEAFEKMEIPRERCSFEVFNSNVCHAVKDKGDMSANSFRKDYLDYCLNEPTREF